MTVTCIAAWQIGSRDARCTCQQCYLVDRWLGMLLYRSNVAKHEPEKYSVFALLFLCLKTCFHRRDSDHRMCVSTGRRETIVALVVPTKPPKDEISAIALSCTMVHYVHWSSGQYLAVTTFVAMVISFPAHRRQYVNFCSLPLPCMYCSCLQRCIAQY
jgi:hypothetical protein